MHIKIKRESLLKPLGPLSRDTSNHHMPDMFFKKVSHQCCIQSDVTTDLGDFVGGATATESPAQGASDDDTGDGDPDPDRRQPQHTHQYIYKSAPSYTLPNDGFVRLRHILQAIPISKSTWWAGVKTGRYPQPVRTLGQRITAWRVEDIRELIKNAA